MKERPYAATLVIIGSLRPRPDGRHANVTTADGARFTVKVRAFQREKFTTELIDRPLELHIWPRTDSRGRLTDNSQLYKWREVTGPANRLSITGRLQRLDAKAMQASVLVRRNKRGNLAREFWLRLQVSPSARPAMPRPLPPNVQPSRGVTLEGHLNGASLRVTRVEVVRLKEAKPYAKRPSGNGHARRPKPGPDPAAAARPRPAATLVTLEQLTPQ